MSKPKTPQAALRALERGIVAMSETLTDEAGQALVPGVDVLARLTALTSGLESLTKRVKAETREAMQARNVSELTGVNFVCVMRESMRSSVDLEAMRKEHAGLVARYTTQAPQYALTFKAKGA